MSWRMTFNNASNPQNARLGEFLAAMLNENEEAALRVYDKASFRVQRVGREGKELLFCVLGPTNTSDIVISQEK